MGFMYAVLNWERESDGSIKKGFLPRSGERGEMNSWKKREGHEKRGRKSNVAGGN